jgi:hypothetical protein
MKIFLTQENRYEHTVKLETSDQQSTTIKTQGKFGKLEVNTY